MSARIRYAASPGQDYVVTIERLADGFVWDGTNFVAVTAATIAKPIKLMPSAGLWVGRYEATVPTVGWKDGAYAVNVHRNFATTLGPVVTILEFTLYNGDDAPPPPAVVQITVPTNSVVTPK